MRILLADDDTEFCARMSAVLDSADDFELVGIAENGEKALSAVNELRPDVLIIELMLPVMDGWAVCKEIRAESDVPIIMLTAREEETDKVMGLELGADDYITKPFNMEVLKLRINKIIEMNVKRQEIFNQDIKIEPSRITITPLDQQLVEKAIQIVEDNISETEFSVEELASSLNISRSYFYKKMIKITGKKPIEFIRTIRMKRAQQLLTESQMQVSEIAYTLGYNSPKIFSKHFKEEFNISPSEFIRQQAE